MIQKPSTLSPYSRWARLMAASALIALVWLGVLPYVGAQAQVARHIATQEQLGIDPSAMFYSELKMVPSIAHHVERLNESHGDAFWKASRPAP